MYIYVRLLVSIKIALESIKFEMERIDIKKIMVFSDSQYAVVILTLGSENKSHTQVIFEVKKAKEILESQNGIYIIFNRT